MRICILSMQRVGNFGSLLQSFGLKRMLEQLGHTVSFLDIEPNWVENRLLSQGERKKIPWDKWKKIDKYALNRLRIRILANRQEQEFERFRRDVLGMRDITGGDRFDCCVIGSDEVFHCLSGAPWGFTSQLFGNVRQARRVITYAASCGATVYEDVPEPVRKAVEAAFSQVAAFSVRDENTRYFVSQLTEKPILEHMDPVLVTDFQQEKQGVNLPEGLPERYCIVYSYYNRINGAEDIRKIRKFCKNHHMALLAVGAPQMWIRNYPVMTPFEVLRVFEKAAFVITDTFHGTIFAAKYARRFAIVVRKSNEKKLQDLIGKLGLEEHLMDSMERLEEVFTREHDPADTQKLAACGRSRSMRYLKENLY